MSRFLAVLVLVPMVAGCLGGSNPNLTPDKDAQELVFREDWAEAALGYGEEHDHDNPAHHNFSTPNFKLLGWNPLVSGHYGTSAGGYLCGDSADKGQKRLSVVHGLGSDVAIMIVDVTDPVNPQVVGELNMPTAGSRDVAITPDGKYVVLGTTGPKRPEKGLVPPVTLGSAMTWESVCNEEPVRVTAAGPLDNVPWADGVVLVNIQNPKQPTIESYYPEGPLGVHSIYATQVRDSYYVIASVVNLVAAVSFFHLYEIQSTAAGAKLVHLAYLLESPVEGNVPLINGHNDAVIGIHPVTQRTYAYLAHWHQGLVIVDITNPRVPMTVGRWTDNPPGNRALGSNDHGDIHEALPLDTLWNGRHYTFVGQEILGHPSSRPTGYMKALDTTDPMRPKDVAMWTLPVDVQWSSPLQFSTHYISRHNQTIFMSNYHAGVWAIDVSDIENNSKLPSIGVFLPTNVSPKPPPSRSYSWTPTVMDNQVLSNGDIVVWDSTSGCYVVRFDATQPAPARRWEG